MKVPNVKIKDLFKTKGKEGEEKEKDQWDIFSLNSCIAYLKSLSYICTI